MDPYPTAALLVAAARRPIGTFRSLRVVTGHQHPVLEPVEGSAHLWKDGECSPVRGGAL